MCGRVEEPGDGAGTMQPAVENPMIIDASSSSSSNVHYDSNHDDESKTSSSSLGFTGGQPMSVDTSVPIPALDAEDSADLCFPVTFSSPRAI